MINTYHILRTMEEFKFVSKRFKAELEVKKPMAYYFLYGSKTAPPLPGEDENTHPFEKMMNRFSLEQIAAHPDAASWYALEQRKPFPEGEAAIAKDPKAARSYCLNTLFGAGFRSALDHGWLYKWAVERGYDGPYDRWYEEAAL